MCARPAGTVIDASVGERHLIAADATLAGLIARTGPLDLKRRWMTRPVEPYGALLRSIVGQQLSTKAASTIFGRLTALFGDRTPTPPELLAADVEQLRAVGLSRPKVSYVRDLAEHVIDGRLKITQLPSLSDEEVARELRAVKGLGQWTADMFLLFHLRRPDVLPVGDLGIRRAVEHAYALPDLPPPEQLIEISESWRPHRSLACLYLWHSLDDEPNGN